jgi:hypothetical protein
VAVITSADDDAERSDEEEWRLLRRPTTMQSGAMRRSGGYEP